MFSLDNDTIAVVTVSGEYRDRSSVWAREVEGFAVDGRGGYSIVGGWMGGSTALDNNDLDVKVRDNRVFSRNMVIICVKLDTIASPFKVCFVLDGLRRGPTKEHRYAVEVESKQSKITRIDLVTDAKILFAVSDKAYKTDISRVAGVSPGILPSWDWADPDTMYHAIVQAKQIPVDINRFVGNTRNAAYYAAAFAAVHSLKSGTFNIRIGTMEEMNNIPEHTSNRRHKGRRAKDKGKKGKIRAENKVYRFTMSDGVHTSVTLPDDYYYHSTANDIAVFQRSGNGSKVTIFQIMNSLNENTKEIGLWVEAFEEQTQALENLLHTARLATESVKGIEPKSDKK